MDLKSNFDVVFCLIFAVLPFIFSHLFEGVQAKKTFDEGKFKRCIDYEKLRVIIRCYKIGTENTFIYSNLHVITSLFILA